MSTHRRKDAATAGRPAEKTFEDLLDELDEIVRDLEGGQIGLDAALARYEKGIAALKRCYDILRAAERKIEVLTRRPDGTLATEPFAPDGEDPAAPPVRRGGRKGGGAKSGPDRGEGASDADASLFRG